MSAEEDKNKEDKNVQRAVTIGTSVPLDHKNQINIKKRKVSVPRLKLSRSKSSSFIPGFGYTTTDNFNGETDNVKAADGYMVNSGQNESLFNGTLISTASPDNISRYPTVVRRNVGPSPQSFMSCESGDFRVGSYKLDAVSPMSDGSSYKQGFIDAVLQAVERKEKGEEQGVGEKDEEVSEKRDSEVGEAVGEAGEQIGAVLPQSSNSILNPLRGIQVQKTNSLFKEPSAFEREEIEETVNGSDEKGGSSERGGSGETVELKSVESDRVELDGNVRFEKDAKDTEDTKDVNSTEDETKSIKDEKITPTPDSNSTLKKSIDTFESDISYNTTPPLVPISSKSSPSDPNTSKPKSLKSWVYTLIILLILCFAGLIVSTIFAIIGSNQAVTNYISRLNPGERSQFLESLNGKYYHVSSLPIDEPIFLTNNDSNIFASGTRFKGLSYSPQKSMEPNCGTTFKDIQADMVLLSKVTEKIRNYSMQCNQSEFILEAIHHSRLNLTLSMGVWIGRNTTVNTQQLDLMKKALSKYPRKYFDSIFVGNEVLFREDLSVTELITIIKDVKKYVKKIGYGDLPIGTSEIGSLINKQLLEECDIVGANVHPFFGGVKVSDATDWTLDFLKYQIQPLNKETNTKIVVSEVGWPYKGGSFQGAVANATNFQEFVESWVCRDHGYDYFYFEAFDEPWKRVFYEGGNEWETEWGVFRHDREVKGLPIC